MNKLYDLLKYIIYASFYMIVIKTGMDFYGYKRFPKLYESYSAPWYTEASLFHRKIFLAFTQSYNIPRRPSAFFLLSRIMFSGRIDIIMA